MLCGGGYLGDKSGYGGVGGVGGVYSSNYGCYYTNMDYLSPSMGHSPINVPPVSENFFSLFVSQCCLEGCSLFVELS